MSDLPRGTSPTSENSETSQNSEYATWLTKQQAADALGVTTKTIEQWAKDGKLQQAAYAPQNRGPKKAVYNPDDVRRIASERRGGLAPFVLPAIPASNSNGHGQGTGISPITPITPLTTNPTGEEILRLVFTAALQRLTSETSESSEKSLSPEERAGQYVTLPEAAAIKGRTVTWLRRQIAAGTLKAEKDRGWRIRRRDLENL